MTFSPKFAWGPWLSWARALVASLMLGVTYLAPERAGGFVDIVLWAFLAYALLLALTGKGRSGMTGLLVLFGDTLYFLIVAGAGQSGLLGLANVFLLYLLAEALAFYGPVEVFVITALSTIFCAVHPDERVHVLESTAAVGGIVACAFAVSRRRLNARLEALAQNLEEARKAGEKARELERVRIASDFHDGPLQSFISLQMRLEILRKLLERDFRAGMDDLKELQALALTQVRDIRVFLHSMRPVDVDGANLISAARRAAESFQKESGIPVTFLGANKPVGLPEGTTSEVLQMVREALHNVQKHAGATRVAVALDKTDRGLEISVEDNGHGFAFAGIYTLEELELLRLGPASLKRRARSLNAEMTLESRPGRGSGVKFRIPLQ